MRATDELTVEVVFALPDRQVLVTVTLSSGATVGDAILQSGLPERFTAEQLHSLPTGIWGHPVARSQIVKDGDRVEIYRPLEIDPREARRQRA